jgi:hypothetical protein
MEDNSQKFIEDLLANPPVFQRCPKCGAPNAMLGTYMMPMYRCGSGFKVDTNPECQTPYCKLRVKTAQAIASWEEESPWIADSAEAGICQLLADMVEILKIDTYPASLEIDAVIKETE